ncbi:unnamed protein product [Adineta steineri]|uniref:Fe2OG dioxygenase domain-containing protein n=1 Tax=Adineta steineri TaxID=433720 RepID=A0A814T922_9BILA|nr:unnamed protein product [Adineta steineri]CAF1163469.1 unnamed protein product [Adineta steineri]CAF3975296.1 unnamed protein product [Adineta steineri]CAF4174607.1 unnamed protein product [Adineta steineri]
MADEGSIQNLEAEWHDFLVEFHANTEEAKQRIQKVDLFPDKNIVCFVLYKTFSPEECQFLIDSIENIGFNKLLYGGNYRTNTRTQIVQKSLADEFLHRVQDFLPKQWPGKDNTSQWDLMNLNEQIRICRYEPGQYFAPHFDGIYKRSYQEQSQLTIMAYLNDSFTGGHTNFLDETTKPPTLTHALKPETGMVLIFQHEIFHEGEAVITGKKYIMRSDVVYKRFLSAPMSKEEQEARDLLATAERHEDQSNHEEATKCYRKAFKLWPALEKE